ncbi:MAG TPA: ATP-binding cassette domain-containing protein [Roseiflexaceae bacterium]|nr:ATP-binding cassette domain-containing protein [Roseiflexaceae bacterium]
MIAVDRVSYTYPNAPQPVIEDLSLTICEGEFLVVCGPSGAGKSTFLRMLNGLVPHFYGGRFAGEVRVWERSTREHEPRDLADLVGFVFQDPEAQFVVDLVEDEIVFAMENLGLPRALMRRRVEEVLDQLGIAHLRRRRVSTLSGGEQQRVAIAAVLAAQPRALVLDEPTSQIDPHAAEEVLSALQKLNDDLGLTIVLCEHRLERVVQYADRVLYLGGVSQDDPSGPPRAHTASGAAVAAPPVLLGGAREVLAQTELAPPLLRLGRALGWSPLPLTIKEGRRLALAHGLPDPPRQQPPPEPSTPTPERLFDRIAALIRPAPAEQATQGPEPNKHHAIDIAGVNYSYGAHEALYKLSLAARPGEVLALMGRNGSGKTTLLKLLAGLLRPQQGTIRVLGRDVTRLDVADVAAFVGYVPQNPRALLFQDTLREELEFTLAARGAAGNRAGAVDTTLRAFGLAHLAGAYPRALSGGEAQRAALATIMVADPPVLLLDEPTRGLDGPAKSALGRQLRALAAQGRTLLLSTHDVELVAAFADRVALLGDGELVVEGPVREVLSDSLIFSSQIAKLFPGSGWLTVEDVLA